VNTPAWYARIEAALGRAPRTHRPLSGGCIAAVHKLEMPDGAPLVAKLGAEAAQIECEAWMLRYLAEHTRLPVPGVVHAAGDLLIMEWLPGGDGLSEAAQDHAAELLAALHATKGPAFGLARDTLIGGLHQPNPNTNSWIAFFRDHRLLYMARVAHESGRLPSAMYRRIEGLAERLDALLDEPDRPALIHGDMWTGNVLVHGGRISGFVDPAIYYADPEIELAFSTLFGTFGEPFFRRYGEIRPLRPGFFEVRRDLYNLWPLLVHVELFGAAYLSGIERVLSRHGL